MIERDIVCRPERVVREKRNGQKSLAAIVCSSLFLFLYMIHRLPPTDAAVRPIYSIYWQHLISPLSSCVSFVNCKVYASIYTSVCLGLFTKKDGVPNKW